MRADVYSRAELFAGLDAEAAFSYTETRDFQIYRHFVSEGRSVARNPYVGMMQALHDNAITQAAQGILSGRRVAAIMGSHRMRRDVAAYRDVARLARRLTRSGVCVSSGGGPGAMEACHLGAAFATQVDAALDAAFDVLARAPVVPELGAIVAADGSIDAGLVVEAHRWMAPAHTLAARLDTPGESLGIPTWHYGHEPTSPFATHVAKYFQNSIREEGLLAVAQQGVVFGEGRAGTIQEIFQDAAQNFYRSFDHASPMVLLGTRHWTETYPVLDVLRKLFAEADFQKYVLITDDLDEAAAFIETFKSST